MAMYFRSGAYIEASGYTLATPFTMACWFYPVDNTTNPQTFLSIGSYARPNADRFYADTSSSSSISMRVETNGGGPLTTSSTFPAPINRWTHTCFVVASSTSRQIYVSGIPAGFASSSRVLDSMDNITMGVNYYSGIQGVSQFTGALAEVAVWRSALTPMQVSGLAAGFSPMLISPQSLIYYNPLISDFKNLIGSGFVPTGTVFYSTGHCRVISL